METVSGTDLRYYLIVYDKNGAEINGPDGLPSRAAAAALAAEPYTDVFVLSHGWMGDVPAARRQYDKWIGAMAACPADRRRMREKRPGFKPLLIGLHWPSKPWGDEALDPADISFALPAEAAPDPVEPLIDECAAAVADDTPAVRAALRTILSSALDDAGPARLPADVAAAYAALDAAAGLGQGDADAPPDSDRLPFDAEGAYQDALNDIPSYGLGSWFDGAVLAPLRNLSFWRMKALAARFGEGAAHRLLADLAAAVPAGRDVKFHVMGHSFGCIVASAAVAGPAGTAAPFRVQSLALVQGALSVWSYCSDIPYARGKAGYFHRLIADGRVAGPIITTQSKHDTAVGRWYPYAAGVARQLDFAPGERPPRYAALGTFGAQGPGADVAFLPMSADLDGRYGFEPGKVYNLDGSDFIIGGGGSSGAHNEIDKPEVAHAVWEAAGA